MRYNAKVANCCGTEGYGFEVHSKGRDGSKFCVIGSLDAVECKTSFTDLDQDVKSRAFDFKIIRLILSD